MTDEQIKGFALMGMAQNFGKDFQPENLKMWLMMLAGYTPEQVQAAVVHIMRTHKFAHIPPFAVMQDALDLATGQSKAAIADEATHAWQYMMRQVGSVGRNRTPELPERTAEIMRSMGGWEVVCNFTEKEMPWKEKRFVELWQGKVDGDQVALVGSEQIAIGG